MLFIPVARRISHVSTRHSGVNVKSSLFPSYKMIYSSDLSCSTCVLHGRSSTSDMTAAPTPWEPFVKGPKRSEKILTLQSAKPAGRGAHISWFSCSLSCLTSRGLRLKYWHLASSDNNIHPKRKRTGRIEEPTLRLSLRHSHCTNPRYSQETRIWLEATNVRELLRCAVKVSNRDDVAMSSHKMNHCLYWGTFPPIFTIVRVHLQYPLGFYS